MAFRPVRYKEVQNFINRAYNECQAFQWGRETLKNSLEAGATKVHYGVEYQAVESKGVYRRLIADNGRGMDQDQLFEYFSHAGSGGKKIGGEHDNFGIGAKISLMPWNPYGVVIVSWVDGQASMIWIQKNRRTGEYGLRSFDEFDDSNVVAPFDDPLHGCDWRLVKPSFVEDHGTVIVLLGTSATDDTVLGDPNRPEERSASARLIHYLNRRFWTLPQGVEVSVNRFLSDTNKPNWPKDAREGRVTLDGGNRKGSNIHLYGGRVHVTQSQKKEQPELASGTVHLRDGTAAHWFLLQKGEMPDAVQGPGTSFIGVLYDSELYHVTAHHAHYRTLGVTPQAVRTKLWLVLEPPIDQPSLTRGVYPESARSALKHSGTADRALPLNDWLAEFARHMPQAIRDALAEAFGEQRQNTELDSKLMARLSQYLKLWGKKFKQRKLVVIDGGGEYSVDLARIEDDSQGLGDEPRAERPPTAATAEAERIDREAKLPHPPGDEQRNSREVELPRRPPEVIWRPKDDFRDPENHFADWIEARNAIHLNLEHRIITEQVSRWQARYPDHCAEVVAAKVKDVYRAAALSVFLATEGLSLGKQDRDERFRQADPLTLALMGYFREDEIIRQQLSAQLGKAGELGSAA